MRPKEREVQYETHHNQWYRVRANEQEGDRTTHLKDGLTELLR